MLDDCELQTTPEGAWLGRAWSVGSRELCELGRETNVEAPHGEQPASLHPRKEAFVISSLLWGVHDGAAVCPGQGYPAPSPAPAPVLMASMWRSWPRSVRSALPGQLLFPRSIFSTWRATAPEVEAWSPVAALDEPLEASNQT